MADNEEVCMAVILHLYDRCAFKRYGPLKGVDPDYHKHDIGQFSTKEKSLLRSSWRAFTAADPAKCGYKMFMRMFKNQPKTKELFTFAKDTSLESMQASTALLFHTGRVVKYISMVIDSLDDVAEAIPLLRQLGGRHGPGPRTHQVPVNYFPYLGVAMRQLMRESGVFTWDGQMDSLWEKTYTWIIKRMEEGMEQYGKY